MSTRLIQAPYPSKATYLRRRALVGVMALGFLLLASRAATALGGTSHPTPERSAPTVSYVVKPGDTLWSIAGHLEPSGNRREVVDQLHELHPASELQPGDVIHWQTD